MTSVKDGWKRFQERNPPLVADGDPGAATLSKVVNLEHALGIYRELDAKPGTIIRYDGAAVFGDFRLGARSLERMEGVHCDMQAVAHYAIRVSEVDFGIPSTGGVRTMQTQRRLTREGKSRAKHPRHVTGHALDIYAYVDGEATWEPRHVLKVHEAFEAAALALDVPLRWGGDWDGDGDVRERGENDLVHHELPRVLYGTRMASQSPQAAEFLAGLA